MRKGVGILLVLLFLVPTALAQEKHYTREHSEELFPLINWEPYSPETFEKALAEQKPIFLLISAPAWCYWCHVYESEDFLFHEDLYPYINEHFIPVFVDSDKRPDLTKKYLEGGWPSTTILTPDLRRITGYTGPRDPIGLLNYFTQLTTYLADKDFQSFATQVHYSQDPALVPETYQFEQLEQNFLNHILATYDKLYGGFIGQDVPDWREGQKFPRGFTQKYLIEQFEGTGSELYRDIVLLTFNNQYTAPEDLETLYRLYDPVEGGFHRYSTKRNWTIPHYEKMLADQAKLISAYGHLLQVNEDLNIRTAVLGSVDYVKNALYDPEGGFYSSQDAYLEHEYYGLDAEGRAAIDPPYIDKNRFIPGNAMMINTFLDLFERFGTEEYKNIATNSLDFIEQNMITQGVAHGFDYEERTAFLTGQAQANAWALLAFVTGYEVTNERTYLKTAEDIAEYIFDNLYDWNAGGIFERNSKDVDFYAPNERIDLSKPYQENAVFAHAIIRLYLITENIQYLEAGMKTLGWAIDHASALDETYHTLKAAELTQEKNLVAEYRSKEAEATALVEKRKQTFFVNDIVNQEDNSVTIDDAPQLKDPLSDSAFLILALLALIAGLISFISPCTLPVLTAYIAYNVKLKKGQWLLNTLFFFLGLALVFSLFGMGATLLGNVLREHRFVFTKAAGIVVILFGVVQLSGRGFSGLKVYSKRAYSDMLGSFLFGAFFAVGWSACIGPILASLLLIAATSGTVLKGTGLLFVYAIGLALPLIFLAFFFDRIKSKKFWKLLKGKSFHVGRRTFHTTYVISGMLLIILGVLIFQDYLFQLNQFSLESQYVQNIILRVEEFLKGLL